MAPGPLAVYLRKERVGTLAAEQERPRDYTFSFGQEFATTHEGEIVLSVSLPVRAETYPAIESRPFFEGLLPEGGLRDAIARNLHISEDNSFGLLRELGLDSAGAVVLLPDGEALRSEGSVDWLDEQELTDLITRLPTSPLGVSGTSRIRLSLAGLQRKAVLIRSGDGTYGVPNETAPSTHILKPQYPDTEYNNLVYNEAFCMRVAQCVGLSVAATELTFIGEMPCLSVARFDRSDDGLTRTRLHQEDFCQALGIPPGRKYESEGGPDLPRSFALVRDVSYRAGADVLALIRAVALNFVLGNNDAHGKNFAVLYGERGLQLAPLYDIVSTAVYPNIENSLAMSIGGEADADKVRARHVTELAKSCGLNPRELSDEWGRIAGKTAACAESVAVLMKAEGLYVDVIGRIVDLAKQRAGQLTAAAT